MKIQVWFKAHGPSAVLADSDGYIVRLWAQRPEHPATLRALRRFFPGLRRQESFLRLGGFRYFTDAAHALAEAKMTSTSPVIQALHLVEGWDEVGMATIPHPLLVGVSR